jgi:phosphoglycerate dehydrogenase-like enzyme
MKIVFHGANAANFRSGFEAMLAERHEIVDVSDALDQPGERAHFETAHIIVGIKLSADEPVPHNLQLYHAPAAGVDAIDAARLPPAAKLCNCFGHEHAIAEYVMAALLMRHVPLARADERLRAGHWDYWAGRPNALRTELGDQTIGLLGFGHIGQAIAARAKAFGMRISAANRSAIATNALVDERFGLDQLSAFMGSADAIVVSLPLTDTTRGIVGQQELAAMRDGAAIINVGRGPVIDEPALYDALATRRISAVIDTWYTYPSASVPTTQPSRLPFQTLPNVVMTPHMSGWTAGTVRRRQQTMADNINRLMRGETLSNVLR